MKSIWIKIIFLPLLLLILSAAAMNIEKDKYYHIKSALSGDEDRGYWDQYFNYVNAAKFNSKKGNSYLQNYLNNMKVPEDQ